ncbi:MAG TPA: hypothetical protein VFC66_00615, partial [Anaerolineaceae bacterium]|nr:hypothetical protein [Anaerolineaceae bacterium]
MECLRSEPMARCVQAYSPSDSENSELRGTEQIELIESAEKKLVTMANQSESSTTCGSIKPTVGRSAARFRVI